MAIQHGLQSFLTSSAHELDNFFEVESMFFSTSSGNLTKEYLIFCRSVHGLIAYVKSRRNIQDARILIGIDGGQGSLKIILNMENSYGAGQSEFRDSGVKRCFILALVENVQENYDNVSKMWKKLELGTLDAVVTGMHSSLNITNYSS